MTGILEDSKEGVLCFRNAHIRLHFSVTLQTSDTISFSRFNFRMSDNPALSVRGHVVVEMALTTRADCTPLGWLLVNSCLHVDHLGRFVGVNSNKLKHRCLPVVSANAFTDFGSPEVRNKSYRA